jgi:isopentenyldiphosphate isomerase
MEERIPSINWNAELYIFKANSKEEPTPDYKEVSETKWYSKKDLKDLRLGFKHKEILSRFF